MTPTEREAIYQTALRQMQADRDALRVVPMLLLRVSPADLAWLAARAA